MADKTDIAVQVFPKLEERIVDLSNRLEQVATSHAPQAWETAKAVVQVDAATSLFAGFLGVLFLIAAVRFGLAMGREYATAYHDEKRYRRDEEVKYGFGVFAAIGIGGVGVIVALLTLFDLWLWAGIFHPELVIARRVMDGLL